MPQNIRSDPKTIKFTIENGCIPIMGQAREPQFAAYLTDLNHYDPNAEYAARLAIRGYLNTHTEVTAAWMACTGVGDQMATATAKIVAMTAMYVSGSPGRTS